MGEKKSPTFGYLFRQDDSPLNDGKTKEADSGKSAWANTQTKAQRVDPSVTSTAWLVSQIKLSIYHKSLLKRSSISI